MFVCRARDLSWRTDAALLCRLVVDRLWSLSSFELARTDVAFFPALVVVCTSIWRGTVMSARNDPEDRRIFVSPRTDFEAWSLRVVQRKDVEGVRGGLAASECRDRRYRRPAGQRPSGLAALSDLDYVITIGIR